MNAEWRKVNIVCSIEGDGAAIQRQPLVPMRADLLELFDVDELKKYMTEDELPKGGATDGVQGEVPGLARRRRGRCSSRTTRSR